MNPTCDVLIIGNGALGLSTALALRRADPKTSIAVVGPHHSLGGASQAAGAMTSAWGEVTAAGLSHAPGRRKHTLAVEAIERWPEWLSTLNEELPKDAQIEHRQGTFIVRNTVAGPVEDDNFTAMVASLADDDEPHEFVRPADVPGLMPNSNTRALQVLHIPREGGIDSERLLAGLERRLYDDPCAALVDDVAAELIIDGDRCLGAVLGNGDRLTAAHTVLAAGVHCQSLLDKLPELARRIPRLVTSVGSALLVRPQQRRQTQVIRTPNRAAGCGLHVVPRAGDNVVYIGATSMVHLTPLDYTVAGEVHSLLTWAQEQIDMSLGAAEFLGVVVGNRPVPIDGFPLVGRLSIDGLSMASGTFRDGLHISPVIGSMMAAVARGDGEADPMFRPERPPLSSFDSREDAISAAVAQLLSSSHEHKLVGVGIGFPRRLRLMFERFARDFYDRLQIDYIPPFEMLMPVEMVGTLEDRDNRALEVEALFADLIAAHQS